MTTPPSTDLAAGQRALDRGEWEEARRRFRLALDAGGSAEAWEGLAAATWWLEEYAVTLDARENAFRLYAERGDRQAAARMANWLAIDSMDYRNEMAVANGWLGRAARLVEDLGPTPELGYVVLIRGHLALMADNDAERARQAAAEGRAIARAAKSTDVEVMSIALEGLAQVSEGAVTSGLGLLDEATAAALGGEMRDLNAVGVSCCYMIHACERVRDYDRASQWCLRVREFCRRWRFTSMFTVCRMQYASVLMHRGEWDEAEKEIVAAIDELKATRPKAVAPGIARLAELRRRQGRVEEAAAMFESVKSHPIAILGRGELALDLGDARAALDLADQLLRRVPANNRTERLAALDLRVRAAAALGDDAIAGTSAAELVAIAERIATGPMQAIALAARGVAVARRDPDRARAALEDAADLFERVPMPFEAERARRALGKLNEAGAPRGEGAPARSVLSPRELDVLRLVARGLSDKEIADQLHLSPHTVHRHVANVLGKLDLPSRAAAVAHATRLGLLS
jgi:DNA-binding NarL/FixJ family response regulator